MLEFDSIFNRSWSELSELSTSSSMMSNVTQDVKETMRTLTMFVSEHNGDCDCLSSLCEMANYLKAVGIIAATQRYVKMNCDNVPGLTKQDWLRSVLQGKD